MNKNIFFKKTHKKILTQVVVTLGIITTILFITLNRIDIHLQTSAAPKGIVSFELARTLAQTEAILDSWNTDARLYAALSLGIDYLFLVLYSSFLFLLISKVSHTTENPAWIERFGNYIAQLQILAGVFDALENYFLLRLLFGMYSEIFSKLAFLFASLKFGFIALGILYMVAVLFLRIFKQTTKTI